MFGFHNAKFLAPISPAHRVFTVLSQVVEMAEEEVPIPSTSTSYDAYQARLQKSALVATKHAFQIPSDLGFHRTLDKSFASELDSISARVFSLTDKLLRYSTGASTKGKGKAVLKTEEDFLDNYHLAIVDVVDQLFENAV